MDDDLTTVAIFGDVIEARLALQCLEGEGIQAFLANDALVGTAWHLAGAFGGVKLQVAGNDKDRALELLADAKSGALGQELLNQDDEVDEEESKGEDHVSSSRDEAAQRALKSSILSVLFAPLCLYTGWLLLEVWMGEGELSRPNRKRAVIAAAIGAPVLCWFLFVSSVLVSNVVNPRPSHDVLR